VGPRDNTPKTQNRWIPQLPGVYGLIFFPTDAVVSLSCFAHLFTCFFDASHHLDVLHASVLLERFATGSSAPWTAAGTTGATTAHVAIAVAEVLWWRGCEQPYANRILIERC